MAPKQTDKEIANDKAARLLHSVDVWCSFYRANPHRFCKDYLGLTLKLFQQVIIYLMMTSTNFCFIAARGQQLLRKQGRLAEKFASNNTGEIGGDLTVNTEVNSQIA